MDDFDIEILNREFIDEYGCLNDGLDKDDTYLSFDIRNIPRILSKIIINKQLLLPRKSNDMDKINLIYFSNLRDYDELLKFLVKNISKMPLNNDNEILLLKYMEEFYSISCELNLYNTSNEKKKVKTKKR